MREIKFRAWNIEKKKIVPVNSLTWQYWKNNDELMGINNIVQASYKIEDNFIIMQYIGRKDKNGKEIYEGDIIRVYSMRGYSFKSQGEIMTIIYEKKEAAFQIQNIKPYNENGDKLSAFILSDMVCEVIGNIWENGDLLK